MARALKVTIDSIKNGQQSFEDFPGEGQFVFSRAIDPDVVANFDEARPRSGGLITPVPAVDEVTTDITKQILSIMLPEQGNLQKLYIITTDGKLSSFNVNADTLSSQTAIGTVTDGKAEGGTYYNDFLYIFGAGSGSGVGDDVSRYGPLDGTPTLANGYWKTTLGLTALDGLIITTTVGNVIYPAHWGHVHTADNTLYFADKTGGGGILNKIKTTSDGTNDGSAYNVLDLPVGYIIFDIESYGKDLVISANRFVDVLTPHNQSGSPALFFWDTISDSFYKKVDLPEYALITALQNKAGSIYVWGGSSSNVGNAQTGGCTVGIYDGADGVIPLKHLPDGHPPFQGAVDTTDDRISWGTKASQDANRAVVVAIGSKSESIGSTVLNNIAESSIVTGDADAIITAISYPFRRSGTIPRVISSSFSFLQAKTSLDIVSSTGTQTSVIQFGLFNIGEPFKITKIRIPLSKAVASGVIITPKLLFDDRQTSYTLPVINNTNYPGKKNIVYKTPELTTQVSGVSAQGEHDFILELAFTGTVPTSVKFPILIELETIDD